MQNKPYEVISGIPGQGVCKIVHHPAVDLYVYYHGYYYHKDDSWKLYSCPGTPEKYRRHGMIVRAADVSYKPEKPKAVEQKPEAPKQKPWWTLPDQEGQIKLI